MGRGTGVWGLEGIHVLCVAGPVTRLWKPEPSPVVWLSIRLSSIHGDSDHGGDGDQALYRHSGRTEAHADRRVRRTLEGPGGARHPGAGCAALRLSPSSFPGPLSARPLSPPTSAPSALVCDPQPWRVLPSKLAQWSRPPGGTGTPFRVGPRVSTSCCPHQPPPGWRSRATSTRRSHGPGLGSWGSGVGCVDLVGGC